MSNFEKDDQYGSEIETLLPDEVRHLTDHPGWYLLIGEPSAMTRQLVNKGLINVSGGIWETTKHAQWLVDQYKRAVS